MAILSQVIIILQITGILPQSDIEIINVAVIAVIEICSILGILNNPTDKTNF